MQFIPLLLLLLSLIGFNHSYANEKTAIVVNEFQMLTDSDMPYLGKYLAEMMIKPLLNSNKFELKRTILLQKNDNELNESDRKQWLTDLLQLYQAQAVIIGTVDKQPKQVVVTASLIDTKTATVIKQGSASGKKMKAIINDLIQQLAQ